MSSYNESSVSLGTAEIHSFVVDFSNDLLGGGTIESGTAYHRPPTGTIGTPDCAFGTVSGTITIGPLTQIGVHYLDVDATFSDDEVSSMRIAFNVNYPETTPRAGMLDMIYELRAYTDAGLNDYSVAGVPYWSDVQLQDRLDAHKVELRRVELYPVQTYVAGSPVYYDYPVGHINLEKGTALEIEDTTGTTVATANYTVDYRNGKVTFSSNTAGTAYFINANSYDLYAAAAEVWRAKAAHAAKLYDFSTDGHNLRRSQIVNQCLLMAKEYEDKIPRSSTLIVRGDYASY